MRGTYFADNERFERKIIKQIQLFECICFLFYPKITATRVGERLAPPAKFARKPPPRVMLERSEASRGGNGRRYTSSVSLWLLPSSNEKGKAK